MAEKKEKLFSEFAPVTTQEWMDKITADLKGVPFEKKLVWKTGEGFNVNPFYRAEDIEGLKSTDSLPGEFPFVRGTKKDNIWLVRQDIDVKDLRTANEKAKELLTKGVTALGFKVNSSDVKTKSIAILLDGINPETTELNFMTCVRKSAELTKEVAAYFKLHGYALDKCQGSISFDAFKKPLVKGKLAPDWVEAAKEVLEAGKALTCYKVLAVNGCCLNNAGSYITQELGYALAWGSELISSLTQAGYSAQEVASKIKFNFGISSNYFMEIAKFRAARWLWAEIVAAYGVDKNDVACKMLIHAETSQWNKTVYDAHVNLLRTQTEAMSAAIGGVHSMTVTAFDEIYTTPDNFSERIARNQQLILKEECHFDKVTDPSAGSYYIEVLTDSIAKTAWNIFTEAEEKGGFAALVNTGEIQKTINASNEARHQAVATRRISLLGTNQFPNFNEMAAKKIDEDSDCGCGCSGACETEIEKLNFARGGSEFEALRLATERSDKRPKAFMLTIGNLAMRIARSQFSSNFLGCAGYEIIDNLGFETVEEGVKAARAAKADIIILCSSDDEYATYAPEAYELVKGKELFVVAGSPASMDELKAKGIEHFIHVRSNLLETLTGFNHKLGIK